MTLLYDKFGANKINISISYKPKNKVAPFLAYPV